MKSYFSNIKSDLPAALVVFLVAVPLCLGIALASGASAFSGLITGVIGGIVVGSFSGSQLGVSGPAAGLIAIVYVAIEGFHPNFGLFLTAVFLAGVIQLILGFLKAGIISYYFPTTVIKGMLSAIGIIIILKEIPHAFGWDADVEGEMSFSQPDGHNTFSELYYMLENIHPGATIVAAIGFLVLIFWERPFMKNIRLFQIVQGPLIAIVLGVLMVFVFGNSGLKIGASHLVTVPVANGIGEFMGFFSFPDFSGLMEPRVWSLALVIAVVASLETLLCVEATDKMDPYKRMTPANRELKAQGMGNIVSGLIGGLPVTQVIVRSSANIQSGGKTKVSAILHGLLILLFIVFLPGLLNLIPRASLAAILIVVGFKLAKPKLFIEIYKQGWNQFIPFVVTVVAIILSDLLVGILIGLAVAIFEILWINFKKPYLFNMDRSGDTHVFNFQLSEDVSFLNKASIMKTLSGIPEGSKVYLDASKSVNIHPDVKEIISDFRDNATYKNIELHLIGFEDFNKEDETKQFNKKMKEMSQGAAGN